MLKRTVVAGALLLAAAVLPAPSVTADAEADLLSRINQLRADHGLAALEPFWDLADDAAAQAQHMVDVGRLEHLPTLGDATSGWQRLAENVGVGPTVDLLVDAFMDSTPHRGNILGDYDRIGVGVAWDGGALFTSVIFMKSQPAEPPPAEPPPAEPPPAEPPPAEEVAPGAREVVVSIEIGPAVLRSTEPETLAPVLDRLRAR